VSRHSRRARSQKKRKQKYQHSTGTRNHKSTWKKQIKEEQNYVCLICGEVGTDQSLNIHHKKAKSRGGNIQEKM